MQNIDIDLDDVVYPGFAQVMSDYILAYHGKRYNPEARSWRFYYDQWGMSDEEFDGYVREGIRRGVVFATGDPVPGAIDGLNALDKMGYRIRLVTSRLTWPGLHARIVTATASWLDAWKAPYHSLYFLGKGAEKDLNGIALLDDRVENVRAHRNGFLFARPHNLNDREGLNVVTDWETFVNVVREMEAA